MIDKHYKTDTHDASSQLNHHCLNEKKVHFSQNIIIYLKKYHPYVAAQINRGFYIRAHVLLHLLNELRTRDIMRGLSSNLSLFRNEFNKFNNTRARMLDSI